MIPIEDSDEWEVDRKPTVVEELLNEVRRSKYVAVKFNKFCKRDVMIVTRYDVENVNDRIDSYVGFFKNLENDIVAISSASIKAFAPVEIIED